MVEPIVSIGLLTQHDLNILGQGFNRHFPVEDAGPFSDLIARLDELTCDDDLSGKAAGPSRTDGPHGKA